MLRSDEVVVAATRSRDAVPASLVGSSLTVIDDARFRARQARVLSDVLRYVSDVVIDRTSAVGGLTQVRILGGRPCTVDP